MYVCCRCTFDLCKSNVLKKMVLGVLVLLCSVQNDRVTYVCTSDVVSETSGFTCTPFILPLPPSSVPITHVT